MREEIEKALDRAIVDLLNDKGDDPMETARLQSAVYILDKTLAVEYGMESILV